VSPLERRCRLLLLAYPAAYRRDRGEEIMGTLLEATPDGRKRPAVRDARALILGGLRARAAQNRGLSTAANLRFAVFLGVALFLSLHAFGYVDDFVASKLGPAGVPNYGPSGWPALLSGLAIAATVVLVWAGRRLVVGAAGLAAAAAVCYTAASSQGELAGQLVIQLLCLTAVVALARRMERPAYAWLWLIGVVVAVFTVPGFFQVLTYSTYLAFGLLVCVLAVSLAWIGIDARPAVALASYLLLFSFSVTLDNIAMGAGNWFGNPLLAGAAAIAALAVWRLRRQSVA
jgi:hypothetical protein